MIKRKALEKLSTERLEKYIAQDSRFVPEAIDLAADILKKRGRTFSKDELTIIEELKVKNQEPNATSDEPNDLVREENLTEDPNAVALYPLMWIFVGSVILTTLFGSLLLAFNLIKLKKYLAALIIFVFGFSFIFIQQDLTQFLIDEGVKNHGRYSATPELLISFIGALGIFLFWRLTVPKDLKYRQASIWFPLILGFVLSGLIYLNIIDIEIMKMFEIFRILSI